MNVNIFGTKEEMGAAAAKKAADALKSAINEKGKAVFVAATGASQFEFLDMLTKEQGIDWQKTEMFHLDEYTGIPDTHPASFRGYLKQRLIDVVKPGAVHLINGDAEDTAAECERLNGLISGSDIDVTFCGIGENGHLAFNDPPADFSTETPYLVVELDAACRKQQLGEGWFKSLEEVPEKAISMSIRQIMKSRKIICTIPDERKAEAVRNCLEKEVSNMYPASILREHGGVSFFLDGKAASMLGKKG